jgi:DNA ligase-associated metallophosphoesterase
MKDEGPAVSDLDVTLAGTKLQLCPEGAVWWREEQTLFVADLHWGKTATFRAHGIAVCDGPLHADLERLSSLLCRTQARRLIVLGDLLHHRRGRPESLSEAVVGFRRQHAEVEMLLIRGNHDRGSGDPPAEWNIACRNEGERLGPFELRHFLRASEYFVLAGHEHPKIRLYGAGRMKEALRCFWRRGDSLVLPAFSSFVDSAFVHPEEQDELYLLAGDQVVPLPAAARIKRSRRKAASRAPAR